MREEEKEIEGPKVYALAQVGGGQGMSKVRDKGLSGCRT